MWAEVEESARQFWKPSGLCTISAQCMEGRTESSGNKTRMKTCPRNQWCACVKCVPNVVCTKPCVSTAVWKYKMAFIHTVLLQLWYKDIYQKELWVISTHLDDGRAGVPPHILHGSSTWGLKTPVGKWLSWFGVWKVREVIFGSVNHSPCFPGQPQKWPQKTTVGSKVIHG